MSVRTPLPPALTAWAEGVVGPVRSVRDVSRPPTASRVWELTSDGARACLKVAPTPASYARETRAYREAAPALERDSVPRLLETDAHHQALLLTAVPGRPVGALDLAPGRRRALHRRAGAWLRRFHGDARDLTARDRAEAQDEVERAVLDAEAHLERAGDLVTAPERDVVRRHAVALALLGPLPAGYVHGDFREHNWLYDSATGALAVVGLDRARPHAAVADLVRLACGPWTRWPELRTAFLEGFGRPLTGEEEAALRSFSALEAASVVARGALHDDPGAITRGRTALAHLLTLPAHP
ncbi:aminoglycoside phosphotransferase family protein [Streptomyces sp. NPDC052036]|uniref:aminoglycoside phosphotransferase family protein n=1 Tax=unclassified Streptomyces TaxID=2593676 RepID=UPI0034441362